MNKFLQAFGIISIAGTSTAIAQSGTIKGFVYEKGSGEILSYTNVYVKGVQKGAQTDENGYFTIGQLEPGNYTIYATAFGYDTAYADIRVAAGDIVTKKLYISAKGLELRGVDVSARKTLKTTRVNISTTTITPKEIKLLPSAGGEPDIAQYLQVTPGVTFTGDQGGQLYIRGGSTVQTGILLDGVTIYNPFHSIGLYSVFETDAIRSADIYTAGFNAGYGNRTSAILDIHTKDGNNQRLSGVASVSPIMVRGMLEGPLLKQKNPDDGSATFLISAKHSYLKNTSKSLYGGLGDEFQNGLPFSFTDLYGKVTYNGNNGSKINLFGFSFNDQANVYNDKGINAAQFNWQSYGAGMNFVVSPTGSSALINGKFAYSQYKINSEEVNFDPRSSSINNFEAGIDFTYFFPEYSQLKYGIEVSGQSTSLDYKNSIGNTIELNRNNTNAAIFFIYRKNFGQRFIFEPSIRGQYYSSLSKFSPEPRLNMKFNVTGNIRLKAAAGLYSQNIVGVKSDRDIVNYFTGFVLSPDQQILNTDRQSVSTNLEQAQHAVAGVEIDIKDVEINIEPWYKNFSQIIQLNRTKGVNPFNASYDFQADKGRAAGIDLSAKYNVKRLFLWGVVSYQKITYTTRLEKFDSTFETQSYPPPFDRRLNINLVGSYTLGKKKDWDISMRFNFGSPFPFTQTQGFNEVPGLGGNISSNPLTQNGSLNTIYANTINGGRMTPFHRMDISVKKSFEVSANSKIEATFTVTNLYDRNNIFYVNRLENKVYYQLPVFPSLNVSWRF